MSKFSFKEYDSETLWEDYLRHFELTCRVKGLGGESEEGNAARRDLLLVSIGPEHLRALSDQMYPRTWDRCSYEEVKVAAERLFKPLKTIFAARLEFERASRDEGESFVLFYNRLKALARSCNYGDGLDERLRDRFAVGIQFPEFEIEVRQKWPNGTVGVGTNEEPVKSESLLELAMAMERARGEVAIKSSSIGAVRKAGNVAKPRVDERCTGCGQAGNVAKPRVDERCTGCGRWTVHEGRECPAKTAVCRICGKVGHFARVCKNRKYRTDRRIRELSPGSEEADSDGCKIESVDVKRVKAKVPRATIDTELNGYKCCMEYDSGARVSTISKSLWHQIKLPKQKLQPSTDIITGYGNNRLNVSGKTKLIVRLGKQVKELPVVVLDEEDIPLFGLPWSLAFGLNLPKEVKVRQVKHTEGPGKIARSESTPKEVAKIIGRFSSVFQKDVGKLKGVKAVIHLKPGATPIAWSARRVPFPMRKVIENELARLVKDDILEPVDPSKTPIEWCTPTVNVDKGGGAVRICGDFRVTLNPNIIEEKHLMPTFEDLTSKLIGGKYFSVIDLRDAYLQMEVDEESRSYLNIATHMGYFRYKRLPFGLSSSPAKFQMHMERVLAGLNVGILLDDIIVVGHNKESHLKSLCEVLKRLQEAGLRAKMEKCKFMKSSVMYLGHRIDGKGIHPTLEKVEAIKGAPSPKTKRELRAFLGAINYYEKFIPKLHAMCAKLHALTGNKMRWKWTTEEQEVFEKVKSRLSTEDTLVPYDLMKPVIIACDASESGVGAVMFHRMPDGSEKPVSYASRTLTPTEKRYASIDREALAIVFSIKKFRQYVLGRKFILRTDSKPVQRILGPRRDLTKVANSRLVRWALLLSEYDYEIQYCKGKDNTVLDFLSRLPLNLVGVGGENENELRSLTKEKLEVVSGKEEFVKAVEKEASFRILKDYLEHGWPKDISKMKESIKPYWNVREELTLEEGIILRLGRLVVPQSMQKRVLQLLHAGHPGIAAMRSLARYYVWWPTLDKDIEEYVRRCSPCQCNRPSECEVPLYPWNIPEGPWERLHLDFAMPPNGKNWLVGIDAYSKWVEVEWMDRITARALISKLRNWFARYGIPKQIVSDNGPQFTSQEFKEFCGEHNIRHVTGAPYHPKTNGIVERLIRTFKSRYRACKQEGLNAEAALQQVLLCYRNTPQKTTEKPPAVLFMGRRLPTIIDRLRPDFRERVENKIWRQKFYHDQKSKPREFVEGQEVWVKNELEKGWRPGSIEERRGEYSYVVEVGGEKKRKHADQLRAREGAIEEHPAEEDDRQPDGGRV